MAEATTKYKVAKRLSEKQRMKIVKDTAGRAAECYTFATSKNKDLTECLRELVCNWDDKQERGEFSGDAAIEWREKVRAEGRKDGCKDTIVQVLQEEQQQACQAAGQLELADRQDVCNQRERRHQRTGRGKV